MDTAPNHVDKAADPSGAGLADHAQVETVANSGCNGAQETAYELLCRNVGPSTAQLLRQHLRESSRYDEDSYVYKQGLVFAAHLRVETNASLERARCSQQIQQSLDGAVRDIQDAVQTIHSKPASTRRESAVVTAWKEMFQRGAVPPQTRTRRLLWAVATWFAHHPQSTVLLGVFVATAVFWTAIYWHERTRATRWEKQELSRLNTWQEQETAKTEELRAQNQVAAQQGITEQIEQRFKTLEPTFYLLAERLEKSARRVQLPDGRMAWEVALTKEAGFLASTPDPKNPSGNLFVYMAEEPDRWDLTKTSPASSSVELKKNDKAKHR